MIYDNNIYLGYYNNSFDTNFILKNNIKLIINCSKNIPFYFDVNDNIKKIRISINDDISKSYYQLYDNLNYITNTIHKYTSNNNNVLIYCKKGKQLSTTIYAAYLIKYFNYSINEAIKYIININNKSFYPYVKYYNSLNKFLIDVK